MTPREKALLLRLAAAETTQEVRSIVVLRDTLRRREVLEKLKENHMNTAEVTLGSYADPEHTTLENVVSFLQEVERASLPDIVGATSGAWAVCHGAVQILINEGRVGVDENMHPWEYVWKVG